MELLLPCWCLVFIRTAHELELGFRRVLLISGARRCPEKSLAPHDFLKQKLRRSPSVGQEKNPYIYMAVGVLPALDCKF